MTVTVAVIAMGEMGAGVAARLTSRGARVRTNLDGRSEASARRAAEAGVEVVDGDAELAAGADFLLSIVPPARAGELAQRLLPVLRASGSRPLFVDCNAVAPQTVQAIAAPFLAEGLPFADAGIIGGPPTAAGFTPVIYASGPQAGYLARLSNYGLDIRAFAKGIGDASALKMAYAGTTKGASAVMISMMLGAARHGVAEAFIAQMHDSQKGRLEATVAGLPMILRKAYRWDGEMEEIAKFLMPEAGGAAIFNGAAELYRRLAEDAAAGPQSDRMATLDVYREPPKAAE